MADNIIDRAVGWSIQRLANARQAWKTSMIDSQDRGVIGSLLLAGDNYDPLGKMGEDEQRKMAQRVSWIYSDIRLFAHAFASAELMVKKYDEKGEHLSDVSNHPLELLLRHPNGMMDLNFLWQYTIKWMELKGNAFWFLAPEIGDPGTIAEIWPVRADKIRVIPDREKMIRGYGYQTSLGPKIIDPRYIVHFQFPNPFDLLMGEAPLSAALLAMETEIGTGKYQRDTYVSGRGQPRSILSLPEDMGERDFVAVSAQIRDDFEAEQKVIITRAGDLKAQILGLNAKEMEIIGQRQFTRDEIDIVFLGFALHSTTMRTGDIQLVYRMFKDEIVYPTHKLVAGQISTQVLDPFFGGGLVAEFEDIRAQDRALNVQERNVYWRVMKFNEARKGLDLDKMEGEWSWLGDLPVPLATDPAFVAQMMGVSGNGATPGGKGALEPQSTRRPPEATAALPGSAAPKTQVDDLAQGKTLALPMVQEPVSDEEQYHLEQAAMEGIRAELDRWQKVSLKETRSGRNPGLYGFKSAIIPRHLYYIIRGELLDHPAGEPEIKAIFDNAKQRGGGRGRRPKNIQAVNDYQSELESEYDSWADDTAQKMAEAKDDATRKTILAAALLVLLASLVDLGRENMPDAVDLGMGDTPPSPELMSKLSDFMSENESYLETSLMPDIQAKVEKALEDPDIILAFDMGNGEEAIRSVLATFSSRVESYAGGFWKTFIWSRGTLADMQNKKVRWSLDPTVEDHCDTCLEWGDRTYDSFSQMLVDTGGAYPTNTICRGNDRCSLDVVD